MIRLRPRVVLAVLFSLPWLASPAGTQCTTAPASGGPNPHVTRFAMVGTSWDHDGGGPAAPWLVVGGIVTGGSLGSRTVIVHDGARWVDASFPLVPGTGNVVALAQWNGELIVAGNFTVQVTGGIAANIARWDGSTWRHLGSGVAGDVAAMTVHNGELVVAGSFLSAGGGAATNIARWNGTSWAPFGSGIGNGVSAVASCNGSLYAGGAMQFVAGGTTIRNLVRWNGTTWVAAGDPNGAVRTLTVRTQGPTARLFAGGDFTMVGGVATQRVAEMNGATQAWSALGAGFGSTCTSLLVRGTGAFTYEVIAIAAGDVHRWAGTTWSSLSSPFGFDGQQILLHAGQYTMCGISDAAAVVTRPFAGTSWQPLRGKGVVGVVEALLNDGDDLIAGGAFFSIDGMPMNGIARRIGTTWSPLGSGVQGTGPGSGVVRALAKLPNGDVVAGGDFAIAGGVQVGHVARWTGSAWLALGNGPVVGVNSEVTSLLALPNGDLVVGGTFTTAGSVAVNRIAILGNNTWQALGTGIDGPVYALARLPNGDLVAGGYFGTAGGVPCANVARWNGSVWSPLGNGLNDLVTELCVTTTGTLFAGGEFDFSSGSSMLHLARWTGFNWVGGVDRLGYVRALLPLPNGGVLAGTTTESPWSTAEQPALSRFDGVSWTDYNGFDGDAVLALAWTHDGDVVAGGDFYSVDYVAAGSLAVLASTCPAAATPYGAGCNTIALAATELPWLGGTFRSLATGVAPAALPLALFGLQQASVPLGALLPQGLPGCSLLASPDVLVLPAAGPNGVATTLAVPSAASLLNAQLFHQIATLQFGGGGALTGIASSNGLALNLGFF